MESVSDGYATLLDPLLTRLRTRRIRPYVKPGSTLLDIGCGKGDVLFSLGDVIRQGTGIDQRAADETRGAIRLQNGKIDMTLPFADGSFDVVTMLAVLKHLEHPEAILREVHRVLTPGGHVLITVPTIYAKPVLEFLGFRLGVISREGVADHKRYYTKETLGLILDARDFRSSTLVISNADSISLPQGGKTPDASRWHLWKNFLS